MTDTIPTPEPSPRSRAITSETGYYIGLTLLIANLVIGGLAGAMLKVARLDGGGFGDDVTLNDMTIIVGPNADDAGFNWAVFIVFVAVGMLSLVIGLAAASITARTD